MARRIGWSPIGKRVSITIDEAADAELIGVGVRGHITTADKHRATVRLAHPLRSKNASFEIVDVFPRHRGYDFHHLRFGAIAVYMAPHSEGTPSASEDTRFAGGMMRWDS